jgi:hypothetical protein
MLDAGVMNEPVNRLATPLPDSVLDRYYVANPDVVDPRKMADHSDQEITFDDLLDKPEEQPS